MNIKKLYLIIVITVIIVSIFVLAYYLFFRNNNSLISVNEASLTPASVPLPPLGTDTMSSLEEKTYSDENGNKYLVRNYIGRGADELYFLNNNQKQKIIGIPGDYNEYHILNGYPGIYVVVDFTTANSRPVGGEIYHIYSDSAVYQLDGLNAIIVPNIYSMKPKSLPEGNGWLTYWQTMQGAYISFIGNNTLYKLEDGKLMTVENSSETGINDMLFLTRLIENKKGVLIATIKNGIYRVDGKKLIYITNVQTKNFSIPIQVVDDEFYLTSGETLYKINSKDNKTLIPIKGISGGELASDGSALYGVFSQHVSGFCGDNPCVNITLYYIKNDSAKKVISGIYGSTGIFGYLYTFVDLQADHLTTSYYFIDQRGVLYASVGDTLIIVKDGNIIGKINDLHKLLKVGSVVELAMFSDKDGTYIVSSKSGHAAVRQSEVQGEYKINIPD